MPSFPVRRPRVPCSGLFRTGRGALHFPDIAASRLHDRPRSGTGFANSSLRSSALEEARPRSRPSESERTMKPFGFQNQRCGFRLGTPQKVTPRLPNPPREERRIVTQSDRTSQLVARGRPFHAHRQNGKSGVVARAGATPAVPLARSLRIAVIRARHTVPGLTRVADPPCGIPAKCFQDAIR